MQKFWQKLQMPLLIYLILSQTTIFFLHFLQKSQLALPRPGNRCSKYGFSINTGIYQLGTGAMHK